MTNDRDKLYAVLGYTFSNSSLLSDALSHRSAAGANNERLEFLGDAILNFVIAEALYKRYPQRKEGDLSRFRASLVRREALAEIAAEFNIGDYLRLGSGELKSGGYRRESILADAMEAIVAAIYLDSDMLKCAEVILKWYDTRIGNLASIKIHKDPKSRLQEYLQARKECLPSYEVIDITGHSHEQIFKVRCKVAGLKLEAEATGASRRRAEQSAAEQLLGQLDE